MARRLFAAFMKKIRRKILRNTDRMRLRILSFFSSKDGIFWNAKERNRKTGFVTKKRV